MVGQIENSMLLIIISQFKFFSRGMKPQNLPTNFKYVYFLKQTWKLGFVLVALSKLGFILFAIALFNEEFYCILRFLRQMSMDFVLLEPVSTLFEVPLPILKL